MARIPSVAALTKQLAEAKLRKANLDKRQAASITDENSRVGRGQRNPTDPYKYESLFLDGFMTVNASRASVAFFGQTNLALAAFDDSPRMSRGFQPSKIKATMGRDIGKATTAELSKRRYLKYSVDATTDSVRGSYTAPVSADTLVSLKAKFEAIVVAKKVAVKEYGRIWFVPENPGFASTGTDSTPTT